MPPMALALTVLELRTIIPSMFAPRPTVISDVYDSFRRMMPFARTISTAVLGPFQLLHSRVAAGMVRQPLKVEKLCTAKLDSYRISPFARAASCV